MATLYTGYQKRLQRALTEPLILALLCSQDMRLSDIKQCICKQGLKSVRLSCPRHTLSRLQSMGYIQKGLNHRPLHYSITSIGKHILDEDLSLLRSTFADVLRETIAGEKK